MAKITPTDIHDMARHWLNTPGGAYLGSDYGQDAKSLLQRPHMDTAADAFLAKLRRDVPVLQVLPAGSLNLYGQPVGADRLELVLDIAGQPIEVGG
ncbi:MAG TPA: hypothetical protein VIG97_11530 [Luteimonas sp.]